MEYFFNATPLTITTTIDISDSPAVFEASGELPLFPEYIIKIGSEFLRVTSIDISAPPDYIYTAQRGVEGTSAATHTAGAAVVHIISAGGLSKILEQQNEHVETFETILLRQGRVQNADQKTLVDIDGVGLLNHHFVDRFKVIPIDFGDYTILNDDSTNSVVTNDVLKLKRESPTNNGYALISVPVGGDFATSFTVGFQLAMGAVVGEEVGVGVGVYDSTTDDYIVATHNICDTTPFIFNKVESFDSLTTLDVTNLSPLPAYPASLLFFKVNFDGTNVVFSYSYDNVTFVELASVLQSYLTIDTFVIALSRYAVANVFHVGP